MVLSNLVEDPFAWLDMTVGIHVGPNATESDLPILVVKGAACQPGAVCKACGLCCGRTCALEMTCAGWHGLRSGGLLGGHRSQCRSERGGSAEPFEDGNRTVSFITKGWAGGMTEMFTSANSFYVARLQGIGAKPMIGWDVSPYLSVAHKIYSKRSATPCRGRATSRKKR